MLTKTPIAELPLSNHFSALRKFIDNRGLSREEKRNMQEHVDAIDIFYKHKGAVDL